MSEQVPRFGVGGAEVEEEVGVSEEVRVDGGVGSRGGGSQHLRVVAMRRGGHDQLVDVRADDVPVAVQVAVQAVVDDRRHAQQDRVLAVVTQRTCTYRARQ